MRTTFDTRQDCSRDSRLALAAAVSDRHTGRVLTPDNHLGDSISVEDAIDSTLPYVLRIRDDVLAIDCDDTDPKQVPACWEIVDILMAGGVIPVIIASGGQNRLHVFARIPDPDTLNALVSFAKQQKLAARQDLRKRS